jgi:hypothetical protein
MLRTPLREGTLMRLAIGCIVVLLLLGVTGEAQMREESQE